MPNFKEVFRACYGPSLSLIVRISVGGWADLYVGCRFRYVRIVIYVRWPAKVYLPPEVFSIM